MLQFRPDVIGGGFDSWVWQMARRSLQLPWWVKFKSRVKIEIYFVGHTWRDFNWFIFYCCSSNSNFPWRSVQITCTPLTLTTNYALLCVVYLIMQACIACNAYGKNIKSIIICCMTSLVMQYFALWILMRKFVIFMWRKPRLHSK